jgi:hypothetical protein
VSAIPAQPAQDSVREALAAMTESQLARASYSAQIPRAVLQSFIRGEPLSAAAVHRLGAHLLVGKFFQKAGGDDDAAEANCLSARAGQA